MNKQNFLQRNKKLYFLSNTLVFFSLFFNVLFLFIHVKKEFYFIVFFIIVTDVFKIFLLESFFKSLFEEKTYYFENVTTLIISVLISLFNIFSLFFISENNNLEIIYFNISLLFLTETIFYLTSFFRLKYVFVKSENNEISEKKQVAKKIRDAKKGKNT